MVRKFPLRCNTRPAVADLSGMLAAAIFLVTALAPPTPAVAIDCHHPAAWFEGIYPCDAGTCSYPATTPFRPPSLATHLPRSAWRGPAGLATQEACANVCVATALDGFAYHCPDVGWNVHTAATWALRTPALVGPAAPLHDLDACFPDSACTAEFAAPVAMHLRRPPGPKPLHRSQADNLASLQRPAASLGLGVSAGHVEYSLGTCDAATCRFYLANVRLTGHRAGHRGAVHLDLMQATFASFSPRTGAVEFLPGSLDLRLRHGQQTWRIAPTHAGAHVHRDLLHLHLTLPVPGVGEQRLRLTFRNQATPPVVEFTPPSRIVVATPGLSLAQQPAADSSLHRITDRDGDLAAVHWVVDGIPGAAELPLGRHDIAVWASDRRGAVARSPTYTIDVVLADHQPSLGEADMALARSSDRQRQ